MRWAGEVGEVGWKGSGRSTWHVPGLDLSQPLGDIMAESTGLGFPHGACGKDNPEVECACTGTVRREMSRRRCRCCPSTVAVPVPPRKDHGRRRTVFFIHAVQPDRSANVAISWQISCGLGSAASHFSSLLLGPSAVRSQAACWFRGSCMCPRWTEGERFTPAGCLIAADLPRATDWPMFGGRGHYGSNPVSFAWCCPQVPLMRRRARYQADGTLRLRFRARRPPRSRGRSQKVFFWCSWVWTCRENTSRVLSLSGASRGSFQYWAPSASPSVLAWLTISRPGSRGIPSLLNRHSSACHVP